MLPSGYLILAAVVKWTYKYAPRLPARGNKNKKNGDNRTRTCDPLHVKQMLSQLSYVSMRIF